MTDPLDHDGDGRKGGSRPRKAKQDGALTVKVADAIHDGEGGFYPVGHKFNPVDDEAGEGLKAKGLAE